jgi:predicted dehydrogenase
MHECPSLALIGYGAISEEFYLPALAKVPGFRDRLWIVEPSAARRDVALRQFGIRPQNCVPSIAELPEGVEGAFNATPSHLHLSTSLALLERGIAIFVEKPFAETAADAHAILDAAETRLVTANQFRRRFPAYGLAGEMIRNGDLGQIRNIVWDEGYRFAWPTQSGFYFRRPWAGRPRGALLDTGVHVLDIICWWLGGAQPCVKAAFLDGFGGPEGFASATLTAGVTSIEIKVSFLDRLANRYVIEGENGTLEGAILDMQRVIHTPRNGSPRSIIARGASSKAEIGDELIGNFIEALAGRAQPLIDGRSVLPALCTLDAIYGTATSDLPAYYQEWVA